MIKSCAFSGHRILDDNFDIKVLDREIKQLIDGGTEIFYCGMARGFDLIAAECVLKYKKKYALKLIACIPCLDQTKYYSHADKFRYKKILCYCDDKIIVAPDYYDGCMQERNKIMVDRADAVLAYLSRKSGGTYFTVNYAEKQGKKIIVINEKSPL